MCEYSAAMLHLCIHVSGLLGNLVRASLPRYRSFSGLRTPHCSSSFLQQQAAVYYNRRADIPTNRRRRVVTAVTAPDVPCGGEVRVEQQQSAGDVY